MLVTPGWLFLGLVILYWIVLVVMLGVTAG